MLNKDFPDHHDAELVLRLYELRREPTMREARVAINTKFTPKSYDDFAAISKGDHPLNAAYRQVSSYWEMAYSLIRHGVLNPDLAMESNGEGMLLFLKAQPHLEEIRAVSPRAYRNAEWVATETEAGKRVVETFLARQAKAAKAKK